MLTQIGINMENNITAFLPIHKFHEIIHLLVWITYTVFEEWFTE